MRRYDEPIEVTAGLVGDQEGPAHFLWRNRLWSVRAVESRWLETDDWWDGPAARAVRGDDVSAAGDAAGDPSDEHEVWRVIAAPGRSGQHGVCELAYATGSGRWRLRTLLD